MTWEDIDYLAGKVPTGITKRVRPIGLTIALVSMVFLGLTDYLTGYELSFSIFYLIPISVGTLLAGPAWGIALSITAAAIWFEADIISGHHYSHSLIPFWNAIVRLGYFSIHTLLLTALVSLMRRMREMSLRDPLTNAANPRYFQEFANRELQKAQRSQRPITIAYADLDDFKQVNDTLGHSAGDNLLRHFVEVIQGEIRPTDLLARIGGDEFVLLFPETEFSQAKVILARIRDVVSAQMKEKNWKVGISMGAVTFSVVPSSIETLIGEADRLMYQAKRLGKNATLHQPWPR